MADKLEIEAEDARPLGKANRNRRTFGGKVERVKDVDGLIPKERAFVEEYLVTLNASSAAMLAGYSPKNAGSIGSDLLKRPNVARAIEKGKRARLARLRIMQDEALLELRNLVTSDLTHFRRTGNTVTTRDSVEPIKAPDGTEIPRTRALSKIKVKSRTYKEDDGTEVEEHEVEIAAHSKTSALDMYMKHLGMFPSTTKSLEIEDADGNTLVIQEVIE